MNPNKPKILILIDWFLPGYRAGGPIQSTSNLINALGNEYDFAVITKNVDHASNVPYQDVESDVWTSYKGISVYYFSEERLSYQKMKEVMQATSFDFVYINSMYSVPFTVWPLWMLRKGEITAKTVVAPRGMLQAGAVKIRFLKKKIFLSLMRITGIHKKIIWQATDEQEREDVGKFFGNNLDIRVAPNIPKQDQQPWKSPEKNEGEARFVFSSRISEKKNIEFFLQRLMKTKGKILFDLYGPREDEEYLARCLAVVKQLPDHITVNFKGAVPAPELPTIMANYHFSVLTTRAENFGHSIFEGMFAGKPVIISDNTPWRNLAEEKAGWDVSLSDTDQFEEIIQSCIKMDQVEYDQWSRSAWLYAKSFKESPELLEKTREVFS